MTTWTSSCGTTSIRTTLPVEPTVRDYGQFDLNGDGFTGGTGVDRFDLDRTGSTQFGRSIYSAVEYDLGGVRVSLNENSLTDLQILCYYAYSPLYTGLEERRETLLANRCGTIAVTVNPASVTLAAGAHAAVCRDGHRDNRSPRDVGPAQRWRDDLSDWILHGRHDSGNLRRPGDQRCRSECVRERHGDCHRRSGAIQRLHRRRRPQRGSRTNQGRSSSLRASI